MTQPRCRDERLALARRFLSEHDGDGGDGVDEGSAGYSTGTRSRGGGDNKAFDTTYVDDVERGDEFEREFAPWPFRFFGVSGGGDADDPGSPSPWRLEYVSHPRNATYDLEALRDWVLGPSEDDATTTGDVATDTD